MMAAKAPQQHNQPGRFPHCAGQRVRLLWNKKRLGDGRATAALGAGISAALLSSRPASPLRDRDIELRSLWFIPKGQERLFKEKLNREVSICVGSVPDSSPHGEAKELGRRVANMSIAPLEELQEGSSLTAEPFHQAQPCQTLALHLPPPKPTTGTEPPPCREAVGQGRLNKTPASGFLRDKPLLTLPRLTPSKADCAERQRELEAFRAGLGGEDGVRHHSQGEELGHLGQSNGFGGVVLLKRKR